MATYSERTADSFLNANSLKTGWDGYARNMDRKDERYRDGLDVGSKSVVVTVSINDVWGAKYKDGGNVTSCERLGYHALTADFWRGILESGCAITIFRVDSAGNIVSHNLRELAARLAG